MIQSVFLARKALSSGFHEVLDDHVEINSKNDVDRLIFCTGKIFMRKRRRAENLGLKSKTAIVRVEQLYPFPKERIQIS